MYWFVLRSNVSGQSVFAILKVGIFKKKMGEAVQKLRNRLLSNAV